MKTVKGVRMATNKEYLDSINIAVSKIRCDEDIEDDDFNTALGEVDDALWNLVDHFEQD